MPIDIADLLTYLVQGYQGWQNAPYQSSGWEKFGSAVQGAVGQPQQSNTSQTPYPQTKKKGGDIGSLLSPQSEPSRFMGALSFIPAFQMLTGKGGGGGGGGMTGLASALAPSLIGSTTGVPAIAGATAGGAGIAAGAGGLVGAGTASGTVGGGGSGLLGLLALLGIL